MSSEVVDVADVRAMIRAVRATASEYWRQGSLTDDLYADGIGDGLDEAAGDFEELIRIKGYSA